MTPIHLGHMRCGNCSTLPIYRINWKVPEQHKGTNNMSLLISPFQIIAFFLSVLGQYPKICVHFSLCNGKGLGEGRAAVPFLLAAFRIQIVCLDMLAHFWAISKHFFFFFWTWLSLSLAGWESKWRLRRWCRRGSAGYKQTEIKGEIINENFCQLGSLR